MITTSVRSALPRTARRRSVTLALSAAPLLWGLTGCGADLEADAQTPAAAGTPLDSSLLSDYDTEFAPDLLAEQDDDDLTSGWPSDYDTEFAPDLLAEQDDDDLTWEVQGAEIPWLPGPTLRGVPPTTIVGGVPVTSTTKYPFVSYLTINGQHNSER